MILYEVQNLLKILSFLFYTTLVVGSISDKGERMQNGALLCQHFLWLMQRDHHFNVIIFSYCDLYYWKS